MIVSRLNQLAIHSVLLGASGFLCITAAAAQEAPMQTDAPYVGWHSDQAKQLIGFPDVKQGSKGKLSFSSTALTFTSPSGVASVDRATILSVTAGYERQEAGGTTGKISRAVIPFGGGSALAATATNKEVGLLTIEFRDKHQALHGAVFQMPKADAAQAQQMFGAPMPGAAVSQPRAACHAKTDVQNGVVNFEPLSEDGVSVPAEYRVLLYEQLLAQLRDENTFSAVYRDGDNSAGDACPEFQLHVTLSGFSKGNAALRASTGPMGLFVGATSLKVRVSLVGQDGKRVVDREFKASQRGDTESLNVADKIAKSLNKHLKKQLNAQRGSLALGK